MTGLEAMAAEASYANMAPAHAKALIGSGSLPRDLRIKIIERALSNFGRLGLVEMFADFIGLATSVVENNRLMIEDFLVTEAKMHPNEAEKINLPTVDGALAGFEIAQGIDQSKLCHGCAFRLGTIANQCPVTTIDADWCSNPGERPFLCHAELDHKLAPYKACAGFVQMRKKRTEAYEVPE